MKRIITIYLLFLISSVSFGQIEKVLNPADLKQQTIVTEPLSLRKGFLRVGLTYAYSVLDKYFDNSGKKNYSPESTWGTTTSTTLWGQYGVTDRVMVEVGLPYATNLINYHSRIFATSLDTMVLLNSSVRGKGLGDLLISATYQIIPSAENNFSLKAALDITLPTAEKNPTNIKGARDYDAPTGYGVFVLTPRITARMVSYPFSYTGYLSYNYNLKGTRIINAGDASETKFKYGNYFVAGGSFNFHLNEWIALANEVNYSYTGKGEIENASSGDLNTSWSLSYETRLVFQIKRFRLGEAVSIPLKALNRGADPTYVLLTQYVF
jgi:hypothetical protein